MVSIGRRLLSICDHPCVLLLSGFCAAGGAATPFQRYISSSYHTLISVCLPPLASRRVLACAILRGSCCEQGAAFAGADSRLSSGPAYAIVGARGRSSVDRATVF